MRERQHVCTRIGLEAPAAIQISLDDGGHVKRGSARLLPAKGHDRDGHGLGHATGDLYAQLGLSRGRAQPQHQHAKARQ